MELLRAPRDTRRAINHSRFIPRDGERIVKPRRVIKRAEIYKHV